MMTLDEAIQHCEEQVVLLEESAEGCDLYDPVEKQIACKSGECAAEHRQLAEWLKELKRLREQTSWIPISERLPNRDEYIKNNGLFNVSDGNRSYSEYFDIYDTQMFGEPTMNGFRVDRVVTAWMPLPEKYKPESEKA